MKNRFSLLLVVLMVFSLIVPAQAANIDQINAEIAKNAEFMVKTVNQPGFGTLAGEWTVLSLARSGAVLPNDYIENYHKLIDSVVADKKGVLTQNKFTEYSRLIVALTATGKDVTNVGGYNLLTPLANISDVKKQGINGPIWALIAYDTKNFEIPKIPDTVNQNSREKMIQEILNREVIDDSGVKGGWALMGNRPDPDITAMSLYALWPYYNKDSAVKAASDRAIEFLSNNQLSSGGYITMGNENLESSAQVIIALCTMGIDPLTDRRFIKYDVSGKENSVVDALLTYKAPSGGFVHVHNQSSVDAMATDQAMEALAAIKRLKDGKTSLFDMTDVVSKEGSSNTEVNFTDIQNNWAKDLIIKTKGYGISNESKEFKPNHAITRGEFSFALVNGLSIHKGAKNVSFTDINDGDWFKEAVLIAASNGIIEGLGNGTFAPNNNITREEAMTIIQRSLAVKYGKSNIDNKKVEELLNKFIDGNKVSGWAKVAVAFNIENKIIEGRPEGIVPKGNITRAEAVKVINVSSQVR